MCERVSKQCLHFLPIEIYEGDIMKKIRIGSIEILGYIGIIIWVAVVFLRDNNVSDNNVYLFFLGILPNLGATWAATMFAKWVVIFGWKRNLTVKKHFIICAGIFALAFGSEMIHSLFLSSPFDIYDILITIIAQIVIFFIPILTKDRYFSDYS